MCVPVSLYQICPFFFCYSYILIKKEVAKIQFLYYCLLIPIFFVTAKIAEANKRRKKNNIGRNLNDFKKTALTIRAIDANQRKFCKRFNLKKQVIRNIRTLLFKSFTFDFAYDIEACERDLLEASIF